MSLSTLSLLLAKSLDIKMLSKTIYGNANSKRVAAAAIAVACELVSYLALPTVCVCVRVILKGFQCESIIFLMTN